MTRERNQEDNTIIFLFQGGQSERLVKEHRKRVEGETWAFEYDGVVHIKSIFPLKITTKMYK